MNKTLKNILKATAAMFVVGALVALALPALALVIPGVVPAGVTTYAAAATAIGSQSSALWMGSFFGIFGGIAAAVNPTIDWLCDRKQPAAAAPSPATKCEETHVKIDAPTLVLSAPERAEEKYRNLIEAQRAAALQNPGQPSL